MELDRLAQAHAATLGQPPMNAARQGTAPHMAQGPSFDCACAALPTEAAICASGTLAALDRVLADRFAAARASMSGGGADLLLAQQRDWIARRNVCGGDAACIEARMTRRLADLGCDPGDLPPGLSDMGGGAVPGQGLAASDTPPRAVAGVTVVSSDLANTPLFDAEAASSAGARLLLAAADEAALWILGVAASSPIPPSHPVRPPRQRSSYDVRGRLER